MRISDWSSDVCASDLVKALRQELAERCGAVLRLDRIAAHFVHIDGSAQKRVRLAPDPFVERVVPLVDRKSVVSGKSVSVRVDPGGRRIIKHKINVKQSLKYRRYAKNGKIFKTK